MSDYTTRDVMCDVIRGIADAYRVAAEGIDAADDALSSAIAHRLHDGIIDVLAQPAIFLSVPLGFLEKIHIFVDETVNIVDGAREPRRFKAWVVRMEADLLEALANVEPGGDASALDVQQHPDFPSFLEALRAWELEQRESAS